MKTIKKFFSRKKPPTNSARKNLPQNSNRNSAPKLRVVFLGGLNEVGKNCAAFEFENDIVVVDAGLQFPTEDMLGVDFVIPDFAYLEKNKNKIRALLITHGHLDHIGAVPHFLKKFPSVPVYSAALTIGLIEKRLEEFRIRGNLNKIDPEKDSFNFGKFAVSFFRVNHTIPDGVGIFLKTPAGNILHTGDFKFDFSPADDRPADLSKIAQFGNQKIDVLFADSTNARREGFCISESVVAKNLEKIFEKASGRLIIAAFSSSIGRLQKIVDFAVKSGRTIFISGRSMLQNLEIAARYGYFRAPRGTVKKLNSNIDDIDPKKVLILTTGSQGEPLSALSKIALGEHRFIQVHKNDTIVFSSSPIPGNERATFTLINNLLRAGANVIGNDAMDVHASGHAFAGDLKLMFSLVKPRHLVPIHGEFFMRRAHENLIQNEFNLQKNQTHLLENGDILEISKNLVRKSLQKIPSNLIMVDGLGVGDIGTKILRERQIMAENGIVVALFRAHEKTKKLIGDPDIISRGFIFLKESREVAIEAKIAAKKAFEIAMKNNPKIFLKDLKREITRAVQTALHKKIGREPMILPVVVFV